MHLRQKSFIKVYINERDPKPNNQKQAEFNLQTFINVFKMGSPHWNGQFKAFDVNIAYQVG